MKILTAEEEQAHYSATVSGGIIGGLTGAGLGLSAVLLAQRRYPFFRSLTLPLKAFLITSAGTFSAIVSADRASRGFERNRHPDEQYSDKALAALAEYRASQSTTARALEWANEKKYWILAGSWAASMGGSWHLVNRDPYLTGAQKLVQARVYAQGFTVLAMLATAALEISQARKGECKYQTVKTVDPDDPEHKRLIEKRVHQEDYTGQDQWKDMIEAEERRLKRKEEEEHEVAEREKREHPDRIKKRHEHAKKEKEKLEKMSDEEKEEEGKKHKLRAS